MSRNLLILFGVVVFFLLVAFMADMAHSGFVEPQATNTRTRLSVAQIAAFVPSGHLTKFTIPAPYNATAWRITDSTDCTGDCVEPGYSWWPRINFHQNNATRLFVLVGMKTGSATPATCPDNPLGGLGATVWQLNKTTEVLSRFGPGNLFPINNRLACLSVNMWYWSGSQENVLYLLDQFALKTYDVVTSAVTVPVDLNALYGPNAFVWEAHSSADDVHHVGTICTPTTAGGGFQYCDTSSNASFVGCFYYNTSTHTFRVYSPAFGAGSFNACIVDKTGRWTVTSDVDPAVPGSISNRFFDNTDGTLKKTLPAGQAGNLSHVEMGYGYTVGTNSFQTQNGSIQTYTFPTTTGPVVFTNSNTDWTFKQIEHVAHSNASTASVSTQMVCGSNTSDASVLKEFELTCFRLDGSNQQLIVAPLMSDLSTSGGGDAYYKYPHLSVDFTGQYAVWTTNLRGSRLDAFLVRIPSTLLGDTTPPTAPQNVIIQ